MELEVDKATLKASLVKELRPLYTLWTFYACIPTYVYGFWQD